MILFYCGAIIILVLAVVFAVYRFFRPEISHHHQPKTLSLEGAAHLEEVNEGEDPRPASPVDLSLADSHTLVYNSRLHLRDAILAQKEIPDDKELRSLLSKLQEDDEKVRQLHPFCVFEHLAGRLGLTESVYVRVLLWTYGEELELLRMMSEKVQANREGRGDFINP